MVSCLRTPPSGWAMHCLWAVATQCPPQSSMDGPAYQSVRPSGLLAAGSTAPARSKSRLCTAVATEDFVLELPPDRCNHNRVHSGKAFPVSSLNVPQ